MEQVTSIKDWELREPCALNTTRREEIEEPNKDNIEPHVDEPVEGM